MPSRYTNDRDLTLTNRLLRAPSRSLRERARTSVISESRETLSAAVLSIIRSHLAEIRSITVDPDRQGSGAGTPVKGCWHRPVNTTSAHLFVYAHSLILRSPGCFHASEDLPQDPQTLLRVPSLPSVDEVAMVRANCPSSHASSPPTL